MRFHKIWCLPRCAIKTDVSFYQQVGVVNYEILDFTIKMRMDASERENDGEDKMETFLNELKSSDEKCLMESINDSNFFSKNGRGEAHSGFYLENMIAFTYKGLYNLINDGWDMNVSYSEKSLKNFLFHGFTGVFMISRMNLMLFPLYFLFFANYEYYKYHRKINSFELFIEILSFLTIFLYVVQFIFWMRYLTPLHHKFCYILPTNRLTIGEYSEGNNEWIYAENYRKIFDAFKNVNCKVGDEIFESILMHYSALKWRPAKEKMILRELDKVLGSDIPKIVLQYLPVLDYFQDAHV